MHDVATKELEYVQGASLDDIRGRGGSDASGYTPSPGYTPDDGFMAPPAAAGPADDVISPEAQNIARSSDDAPPPASARRP